MLPQSLADSVPEDGLQVKVGQHLNPKLGADGDVQSDRVWVDVLQVLTGPSVEATGAGTATAVFMVRMCMCMGKWT